jgi:uncharacterized protein with von Willebrand factor type A (vWA) domain
MSKEIAEQTQEDQKQELLLLDLFIELRQAGFRLGIDEYKLLHKALQAGFGTDRTSLKRLCQAIWVKSPEEQCLYDTLFEKRVRSPTIEEFIPKDLTEPVDDKSEQPPSPDMTTPQPTKEIKDTFDQPNPPTPIGDNHFTQPPSARHPMESSNTDYPTDNTELTWSPFDIESTLETKDVKDEEQVVKSLSMKTFMLTGEYFPVTGRQMKQSWRYLKRPVREGLPVELDLEATVNQIGYKGILLDLVLVPPRVNRSELFLLLDQDGSMVPFHLLSRRLGETLLHGGRQGKVGIYYFQNYPTEYLYRDCYRQEAESIEKFLLRLHTERSSILIFSDAGAARGRYTEKRVELTKNFLTKLKRKVRYVAWLNPMPKEYWKDTTAEQINKMVPMFEFSRRGLQDAIGVLKGRPTNFEGWTI